MRVLMILAGLAAMALGAWWVGQGLGYIPVGTMAHKIEWAYRGGLLFSAAAIITLVAALSPSGPLPAIREFSQPHPQALHRRPVV